MNTPMFQSRLSRVPRLLALAAVAFGVPAVASSPAMAGEYHFFGCQDYAGRKLDSPDFKFQSLVLGHGENTCASNGYLTLTLPGHDMYGGQYSGYGVKAPEGSGLRFKFMSAGRQLWMYGGTQADWMATGAYKFEYGSDASSTFGVNTSREEWCETSGGCQGTGWPGVNAGPSKVEAGFLGGGATFIGFSMGCQNSAGFSGGSCAGNSDGTPRGKLLLSWMDLTVTDNEIPLVSNASGELLATGTHDGFEKVTFTAADTGSGVLDAFLSVDGKELTRVPTNGAPASCKDQGNVPAFDYNRLQPCARNGVVEMGVNTNAYSDGKHRIAIQVRDAAGNLSTQMVHDIVIDNIPAPNIVSDAERPAVNGNTQVGQTLTAFDGRWSGSGVTFTRQWQVSDDGETWKGVGATGTTWRPEAAHVGKLVRVLVTATNSEGSAQASSASRRVEAGSGAGGGVVVQDDRPGSAPGGSEKSEPNGVGGKLATGRLVASSKSEKIRTGYKKRTRVTGHLVDEAGVPITGASIDVDEKVITSGDRRKVATITTDAKGAYTYESRPTSSRAVELSYSRLRGATTYQSSHAVRVQVQAGMQASLRSRRVASRGLVVMKGRVLASDLPRNGVMVQIKARDRGKWIAAGLTRTKQDGSFTWKYRLRATSGQIPFRAVLRRTGDLPATVNSSRVVKVRIG